MNQPEIALPKHPAQSFRTTPLHFLSTAAWTLSKIQELLRLAAAIKTCPELHRYALQGRVLLMMFQKPSLRTRVSFESAMSRLGGHAIAYDLAGSPWGQGRETPADTARSASRYVDAIVARLFSHDDLSTLAANSSVPVINGMTDLEHPCQVIADLLTLEETFGTLQGLRLAFVGDARNNVAGSLLQCCPRLGMRLTIACPAGRDFQPDASVLERARNAIAESGGSIEIVHEPHAAVSGADAVYTDSWTSYRVLATSREFRENLLRPFRVTSGMMREAKPEAVFMHSLPAWRGHELEADVIDGPQSIVFAQAANRLHTAKALLLTLIR